MKVIYKKRIIEKINAAKLEADIHRKAIDYIVLTKEECRQLRSELFIYEGSCIHGSYIMGILIKVEGC